MPNSPLPGKAAPYSKSASLPRPSGPLDSLASPAEWAICYTVILPTREVDLPHSRVGKLGESEVGKWEMGS